KSGSFANHHSRSSAHEVWSGRCVRVVQNGGNLRKAVGSYRQPPISWRIGESLDPQDVKSAAENFTSPPPFGQRKDRSVPAWARQSVGSNPKGSRVISLPCAVLAQ